MKKSILLVLTGPALLAFAACPPAEDGAKWSEVYRTADTVARNTIEITQPILLDISPPVEFEGIKIKKGGKLTFKNNVEGGLKLVTDHIDIEDGGEMWIGTDECKYQGNVEIVLTGTFDQDDEGDTRFGKKYIGVRAGGMLEIHGEEKTPWTRLADTLEPYEPLALVELGTDSSHINGMTLVEFNRQEGTHVKTTTVNTKEDLTSELELLKAKDEFIVVIQNRFKATHPPMEMTRADCPSCKNDCDPARWSIKHVPKAPTFADDAELQAYIKNAQEKFYKTNRKGERVFKDTWKDEEKRSKEIEKITEWNTNKYKSDLAKIKARNTAIANMVTAHKPFELICKPNLIDDALTSVLGVEMAEKIADRWEKIDGLQTWNVKPVDVQDIVVLVIEKKDGVVRIMNPDNWQTTSSPLKLIFDVGHEWVIDAQKTDDSHTLKVQVNKNNDHVLPIQLADDVSGWKVGDHLVIASSDFDMNQAEEVKIQSIESPNRMTVTTKDGGMLKYTHYGQIFGKLDMRAEVGLLTRNIKIRGRMAEECYITGQMNNIHCDYHFDKDFFGGHTKALTGFKSYNIEGAELTNMGQHHDAGHYPIHLHLADDVSGKSIIQKNSLHHNFARCVTIHYTHHLQVLNNVAYDTFGHCFFIEDGGERDNLIKGNLGLVTRKGFLTPVDKNGVSTFWIASPLNDVENNVAAGSDVAGFWFTFVQKRLVRHLSKEDYRDTMEEAGKWWNENTDSKAAGCRMRLKPGYGFRKSKRYAFRSLVNNVAHSNNEHGLIRRGRVDEPGKFGGCAAYDPRKSAATMASEDEDQPVSGENKPVDPIIVSGYTGYKNRKSNVVIAAPGVRIVNSNLGEARSAIKVERNPLHGYTLVRDVNIYMQTDNIGVPDKNIGLDRSNPGYNKNDDGTRNGVWIRGEGPVHIHNVNFHNIASNPIERFCAITLRANSPRAMGMSSSTKGLTFNGLDTATEYEGVPAASKICRSRMANLNELDDENKADVLQNGADTDSVNFMDLDGTLVGKDNFDKKMNKVVIDNKDYLTKDLNCVAPKGWNMKVCDGEFYRFYSYPKRLVAKNAQYGQFITNGLQASETVNAQAPKAGMLTFTGNTENKLVIHWETKVREKSLIRVMGLKQTGPTIIGFCLPKLKARDISEITIDTYLDLKPAIKDDDSASGFAGEEIDIGNERGEKDATAGNGIVAASSYEALASEADKTVFLDKKTRVLWVKISETGAKPSPERDMEEGDDYYYGDCSGGLLINQCPFISFDFTTLEGFDPQDPEIGDCTANYAQNSS